MAYDIRFAHHLEIDGVPLSTPAWEHLDIHLLYSGPSTRGENRILPGAAGRRALPKRADETNRTLSLAIFGFERWDGEPYDDAVQGLWANIAHFTTTVIDTPLTPNGTRTARLVGNGVRDLSATIQVLGFEIDEAYSPAAVSASLDIAVLAGSFR